jgi:HEAT repeat protein
MADTQSDTDRLTELIDRLMDEDENARYDAAGQIARMGRPALPRVMQLAGNARPRMRHMAAYILGQIGDADPTGRFVETRYPDGVPILVRLLESDLDDEVRAGAAHALGHQADPATLPVLCRAASDPAVGVRYAVACALGSFYEDQWEVEEGRKHRDEVITMLLRLMDDEDEDVRDWATFGIHQGSHDTPATRARLWKALDDPCPEVRGEAAVGLARFGDRSLVPRLEKLLREDEEISPCYFEAAEELGDPCLLSAVLEGAKRWREGMKDGEELHFMVASAVEALQKVASGRQEPAHQ